MANQGFTWGHLPNYCCDYNDNRNLIPEGGYGDFKGRHHMSYYHDCNYKSNKYDIGDKTDDNHQGEWDPSWWLNFINGESEVDSSATGFGRDQVSNDADNDKPGYDNPTDPHLFFNSFNPDKCTRINKPFGTTYKAFACYYGEDINMGQGTGVLWEPDLEFSRIIPKGLSFGWKYIHQTDGGLLSNSAKMVMQSLFMVMRSNADPENVYKLAELANVPNSIHKLSDNNKNALTSNLRKTIVPGKFARIKGINAPHVPSTAGGAARSVADANRYALNDYRGVGQGQARAAYANGTYGHGMYVFSSKTQDLIVRKKYMPIGIIIKFAGFLPNTAYGSGDVRFHIFDVNYIAATNHNVYDANQKYDRVNWEPSKIGHMPPKHNIGTLK